MTELSSNPPTSLPAMEAIDRVDPSYAIHVAELDVAIWSHPHMVRIALDQYQSNPGVIGSFFEIWKEGRSQANLDDSQSRDPLLNSYLKVHNVLNQVNPTGAVPNLDEPIRFDPETDRRIGHNNGAYMLAQSILRDILAPGVPAKEVTEKARAARVRVLAVELGVYIDRVIEEQAVNETENQTA